MFLYVSVKLFRDVRGCTNSTCVQLLIPLTYIPFLGPCFHLAPGPSVSGLGELQDARITHVFNSVFLLTAWYYYFSDRVTFIIQLNAALGVLVSTSQGPLDVWDLHFIHSNLNYLRDHFSCKIIFLCRIHVIYTKISFCERLIYSILLVIHLYNLLQLFDLV